MKRIITASCIMLGVWAAVPSRAQQDSSSVIGFKTVAEALNALKARPDVTVKTTQPDAWIAIDDPKAGAYWSFVPEGHYAYPAAVRRVLKTDQSGDVRIEMSILCENSRPNCDRLAEEFKQFNERTRENIQRRLKAQQKQ